MELNKISSTAKLFISILLCQATGIVSSLLSNISGNDWFEKLKKPIWFPPNYLFGIVWSILYLLMGISLWLIWKSNYDKEKKDKAILFFLFQLTANFLWSIIFFRFHLPIVAQIDILIMLNLIIITAIKFYPISKMAAFLFIPYIVWVCFATILNMSILILNTP